MDDSGKNLVLREHNFFNKWRHFSFKLVFCCVYLNIVIVDSLSDFPELVDVHQQVVWKWIKSNTVCCAQPTLEPTSRHCYFLFCWVSLAGKHLVWTWKWARCEETVMILRWFLSESRGSKSSPGRRKPNTFKQSKGAQEPHNPRTRPNVSTVKARRWKISLVWPQQTSEPWKPHRFSLAYSVCKAERFFLILFFFLRVAANETSANGEEHRHTHQTNPMGQVSTSLMCTNRHLNDFF